MEFTQRGAQPHATQTVNQDVAVPSSSGGGGHGSLFKGKKGKRPVGHWLRIASVCLLFSVTILVVAIASLLYFGNGNESKYVDNSKYQAVDLNVNSSSSGDQIYFGHIKTLNEKYIVLKDIYYIVPNAQGSSSGTGASATQSNNYTLVKLGCELHAPYDQMLINRDHVIFWENLQSSGTVAQKIAVYQQQNPNGPKCSNSTSTTPSTSTTTPTPTTPTTTKKP